MITRIIFGLFSGGLAGGFWYIASSLANYMNPNYSNASIFPITFALVLTLAFFTNSIARVWGWGILLSSLACFYMPIATFIGASKGAISMVEGSQPGLDQAASAVGATIGTGLVTAFTGFIGFFLGVFLLIISYFLLRTSRAELIEIQQSGSNKEISNDLPNRIPQSAKYVLISLLSIGMLVSSFSTIISSPKKNVTTSNSEEISPQSSVDNIQAPIPSQETPVVKEYATANEGNSKEATAEKYPSVIFACTTDKHIIHITNIGGENFKYQSWNKPRPINEAPDLELTGKDHSLVGSANYWKFSLGKTEFEITDQWSVPDTGTPPLEASNAKGDLWVRIEGELKMHKYCE